MIDAIKNLDLSLIIEPLVERQKWPLKDALEAVRRYKNFLILLYLYPNETIVPTTDIDEAWHTHILFTREYTRDCQTIFKKYLHHSPVHNFLTEKEKETMHRAYCRTSVLYRQEFQESYSLELDIATFW